MARWASNEGAVRQLSNDTQIYDSEAVEGALITYAITGRGDVKALAGRDGYRIRIGRYRVIFSEDQITVLAVYVGKRETTTYRKN